MTEFLLLLIAIILIFILYNVWSESEEEVEFNPQIIFHPRQELNFSYDEKKLIKDTIHAMPIKDDMLIHTFDFSKIEQRENELPKFRYKNTRLVLMNDRGNYIPLWEANKPNEFGLIGKQIFKLGEVSKLIESLT